MIKRTIMDKGIKFTISDNTLIIEGLLNSTLDFDFYDNNKEFFRKSNIKDINIYGIKVINFYLFSKSAFSYFNHLKCVNFCDNDIK